MPYTHMDPWSKAKRKFIRERVATCSLDTRRTYLSALQKAEDFFGLVDPRHITLLELKKYEATLDGAVNSRALYACILKNFLKESRNRQAKRWKPNFQKTPKSGRRFLSEKKVTEARNAAMKLAPPHALLYSLMVDNSFRVIDCYRLTVPRAAALLREQRANILSKGRHGGKERPISLHRRTVSLLEEYLDLRAKTLQGAEAPWNVFLTQDYRTKKWMPMHRNTIRKHIKRISAACGIPFDPHDLRCTFGNRHWKNDTPIETIADMMGHNSVDVTFKSYIGVNSDDCREAQDRLG
jgi:integrase